MKEYSIGISFSDWADDSAKFGSLIVYINGCDNNCKGCHNLKLKERSSEIFFEDILTEIYFKLENTPIEHIIFSGGDPLSIKNRELVKNLIKELKEKYKIMVYSGNSKEVVKELGIEGCMYFKCGNYIPSLKQQSGHFGNEFRLASTNQEIIDGKTFEVLSKFGIFVKSC